MTRDEIAQMMQDSSGMNWGTEAHFQRFAALVAEQERQDCARVVMSFKNWSRVDLLPISEAIKSRRLGVNRGQA